MHETFLSFSQVESPAPGASLPQGRHTLRGWVWPKPGGHFVDVRARIGGRIFPGIHGLPRADLAAHFQTGRPVAFAEFYVVVDLAPGAAEVVLEALEIEGRWSAFQTAGYQVTPANPPVHFAVPSGPLRWIDHGFGLKRLLRESARQPGRALKDLAESLAGELPWPRVLRDAPAPLIGFVDEPASVCCCRFGRIPAFGHLFHPNLRTRRILATVDLQSWQPLALHQTSPGPAAHYAQLPNARACGFTGLVDVPAQLPNPVSLRIYAELEDGSLHLCQAVRTRLHPEEEEKLPVAGAGSFDAALVAWDAALSAAGLTVTRDADLDRYLAVLRTEHDQAAQHRPLQPATPLLEAPLQAGAPLPKRVLLATHGLSLQGAPRFLLDLGRAFVAAGSRVEVVSAEDGPLRKEFATLGAKVTVVDASKVMLAASAADGKQALAGLISVADWSAAELVVVNSFTTFWAVQAAKAAGRNVLMYVHESTTPTAFYNQRVSPAIIALAEEAFTLADAVSFTTASTRRYHLGYGRPERHRLAPGWVDVAALDRWLAGQNRDALRREFGVQPGELLVCNIGTVSDRKGQHTFARAVDLLWRRYPTLAARTRFVLLGGRDSPFDAMLAESLAELGRANLIVHPETPDYLRYYLAADVFACSSYEESSPRVVLEAMACRAPILASAVQGIPELVRPDCEAVLLPAGDTVAWCEGLARLLATPAIGKDLAAHARARVEATFAAGVVLPRHLALAGEVAAHRINQS
jgi:glycosyltransferase involved in cell wall biosynthesis